MPKLHYKIVGDQVISRLVGVTFEGRQANIGLVSEGDILPLTLKQADGKAGVHITTRDGKSLGWLPQELADLYYEDLEFHGIDPTTHPNTAVVLEVTGAFNEVASLGLVIGFVMPSKKNPEYTGGD